MTPQRQALLIAMRSAGQARTYRDLASALGQRPITVATALGRARQAGLVGAHDGLYYLTQKGSDRLNWLESNGYMAAAP